MVFKHESLHGPIQIVVKSFKYFKFLSLRVYGFMSSVNNCFEFLSMRHKVLRFKFEVFTDGGNLSLSVYGGTVRM